MLLRVLVYENSVFLCNWKSRSAMPLMYQETEFPCRTRISLSSMSINSNVSVFFEFSRVRDSVMGMLFCLPLFFLEGIGRPQHLHKVLLFFLSLLSPRDVFLLYVRISDFFDFRRL